MCVATHCWMAQQLFVRHRNMSSSLFRSLASLYRGKLIRCTAGLGCGDLRPAGAATVARVPALDWRRTFLATGPRRGAIEEDLSPWFRETSSSSSSSSSSTADARPRAALPRRQGQERGPQLFTWARLAIGSIVAVAALFLHSKWTSFLRIRSEVEMVKDAAETAAEVVEDVAAAAEKVSAEVAGQLPEDGRLRRAAVLVEHASREVAEEAHLARDIIHKVDEIEEEVKAMIKPIVDHGKHKSNHKGK